MTTSTQTSTQHPDMMQMTGDYLKVYGNDFINVGDSVFDFDCYANGSPHDIWIYNNTFRIVTQIDPYPEYFRMYCSSGSLSSITNVKLMNNTFIDNNSQVNVRFNSFNGNPTGAGNVIENNIWYDAGGSSATPSWLIDPSSGFTSSSFSINANVYYMPSGSAYVSYGGTVQKASAWIASNEPNSSVGQPRFVSYSAANITNDLHLQSGDTVAVDHGLSLAAYFTTDKDGTTRPQGTAWDIGAYEFQATSSIASPPTNLTEVVR